MFEYIFCNAGVAASSNINWNPYNNLFLGFPRNHHCSFSFSGVFSLSSTFLSFTFSGSSFSCSSFFGLSTFSSTYSSFFSWTSGCSYYCYCSSTYSSSSCCCSWCYWSSCMLSSWLSSSMSIWFSCIYIGSSMLWSFIIYWACWSIPIWSWLDLRMSLVTIILVFGTYGIFAICFLYWTWCLQSWSRPLLFKTACLSNKRFAKAWFSFSILSVSLLRTIIFRLMGPLALFLTD